MGVEPRNDKQMDNARLSNSTPRQLVCQILDLINQVLRFVIQHLTSQLSARNELPLDGFFRGFDLKEVGLTSPTPGISSAAFRSS